MCVYEGIIACLGQVPGKTPLRVESPHSGNMGVKGMSAVLDEKLIYEILSAVEEIPEGKVASYGQIARLIGRDNNARLVGKVLSQADAYGDYPCHRVVNHAGRLAPHFGQQRELLLAEKVLFRDNDHVDMKICQWDC